MTPYSLHQAQAQIELQAAQLAVCRARCSAQEAEIAGLKEELKDARSKNLALSRSMGRIQAEVGTGELKPHLSIQHLKYGTEQERWDAAVAQWRSTLQ